MADDATQRNQDTVDPGTARGPSIETGTAAGTGVGTEGPEVVHGDDEAAHAGSHGTKAVLAALIANAAIAVAKFFGFVVTGSSSMLAESVHSAADSGNQGLLLLGGKRAKKAADEEHPFGYGRERYFWAFAVALVLFSLGSLFAIYEGLHKLDHPEPVESPEWALGILGFAIVAEAFSFRTAIKEALKVKRNESWWGFIRRAKSPELPVVILEDLGAMVGLVLAFGGVTTAVVTENGRWDAYGTLSIGVLLGVIAIILVIEMKGLLIGESASRRDVEAMRGAIDIEPDVVRLIHFRTQHLGPEELLVGAKVEFQHELTVVEVAQAIDRVERNIRANVPAARVIYIEPDVHLAHRQVGGYVAEHAGHISRDDPNYGAITGKHKVIDVTDDIWSS